MEVASSGRELGPGVPALPRRFGRVFGLLVAVTALATVTIVMALYLRRVADVGSPVAAPRSDAPAVIVEATHQPRSHPAPVVAVATVESFGRLPDEHARAFEGREPSLRIASSSRMALTSSAVPQARTSEVTNSSHVPPRIELERAMRATPITLYSASWCGACKKTRAFMNQQGLSYREVDVERQPNGWGEVERLTARRGVPVLVVDGTTLVGYDPPGIMQAVLTSVERRLKVKGLKLEQQ